MCINYNFANKNGTVISIYLIAVSPYFRIMSILPMFDWHTHTHTQSLSYGNLQACSRMTNTFFKFFFCFFYFIFFLLFALHWFWLGHVPYFPFMRIFHVSPTHYHRIRRPNRRRRRRRQKKKRTVFGKFWAAATDLEMYFHEFAWLLFSSYSVWKNAERDANRWQTEYAFWYAEDTSYRKICEFRRMKVEKNQI